MEIKYKCYDCDFRTSWLNMALEHIKKQRHSIAPEIEEKHIKPQASRNTRYQLTEKEKEKLESPPTKSERLREKLRSSLPFLLLLSLIFLLASALVQNIVSTIIFYTVFMITILMIIIL